MSDLELRRRAAEVVPGGMYGHNVEKFLWPGAPQFWSRGRGSRIWDADGREYVDLMCSWGPIVLGHGHPAVERAAAEQREKIDLGNGPSRVFVELAERLTSIVDYAGWAVFAKNGTDATTAAVAVSRIATGRSVVLLARGSFHGSAPWCHPDRAGISPGERKAIAFFDYNDVASLRSAAATHVSDLAAVILTPHRHDAAADQEEIDPEFAREVRRVCDENGAVLILDEVRTGFRIAFGSSWQSLGVQPDLSCWSKAIANGHPVSALMGRDSLRDAARRHLMGGTFWTSSVPLAAAMATLRVLEDEDATARMTAMGTALLDGIRTRAESAGVRIRLSGPPQMPYMAFEDDDDFSLARLWAASVGRGGVYLNPTHNWFVSAALNADDLNLVLEASEQAFGDVARIHS